MNYFDLYSSYPDRTIAAAWDSQVKEADKTPWLADTLTECGSELFARFAACYAELRALPRSARRALQRRIARSSELSAIIPDGQCSLVEAIVNANNDAATHTDCAPGSGADTIVLPANAYVMLSNPYV